MSAFPCDRDALNLNGSHTCPYGSKCLKWEEGPNRGVISFDNIGVAYLTVFQVISLEGWIQVLYLVSCQGWGREQGGSPILCISGREIWTLEGAGNFLVL